MTEEGFLNSVDVAKMIGVTDRQVRDLADEGVIPAYKIGKTWRFRRVDVEEWHAQQRNRPPEKPSHL